MTEEEKQHAMALVKLRTYAWWWVKQLWCHVKTNWKDAKRSLWTLWHWEQRPQRWSMYWHGWWREGSLTIELHCRKIYRRTVEEEETFRISSDSFEHQVKSRFSSTHIDKELSASVITGTLLRIKYNFVVLIPIDIFASKERPLQFKGRLLLIQKVPLHCKRLFFIFVTNWISDDYRNAVFLSSSFVFGLLSFPKKCEVIPV